MNSNETKWYSFSSLNSLKIRCANCYKEFDLTVPFLDHHSGCCPLCNIDCVFCDWKGKKIQIIVQNSPPEFSKFIRWMQDNFSELEYVELISNLEKLVEAAEK